jgi:hypothetical protein
VAYAQERDRTQELRYSFLYLGSLPEKAEVTGAITFLGAPCVGSSLQWTMLNKEGQIVSSTENQLSPQDSSDFSLSIFGKNAAYLLLDVMNYDNKDFVNYCTIQINSLAVSNPK